MFKSYKFRLYPNKEQELLMQKTFGCVRFVYNQCLAHKIDRYENNKENLSRIDVNNYKNRTLKLEYEWLKEVDKCALDNAVINLDMAYKNFFKERKGYPKFKNKKRNRKTYKTNCNNNPTKAAKIKYLLLNVFLLKILRLLLTLNE